MLVLTRKTNQVIKIGDDIEMTILSVEGEQVKVGIKAPKHIEIHRKEVYLSIQQENSQAGNVSLDAIQQLLGGNQNSGKA
ncbi:carbon storage regulator CsrA [Alkalihalobacterium bogoriense]|uniref:carbon storage regulator CsrA n=1 Tax=Alkalihalobacterium bogoriense TaxID=246272 RepID=UPI000478D153|nr:carbon storage regulator CsrA [Alkalihalobacterium bogoriense]